MKCVFIEMLSVRRAVRSPLYRLTAFCECRNDGWFFQKSWKERTKRERFNFLKCCLRCCSRLFKCISIFPEAFSNFAFHDLSPLGETSCEHCSKSSWPEVHEIFMVTKSHKPYVELTTLHHERQTNVEDFRYFYFSIKKDLQKVQYLQFFWND